LRFEFLAYLQGIETLFPSLITLLLPTFLAYLQGIETILSQHCTEAK